jgi:hypothetical protein
MTVKWKFQPDIKTEAITPGRCITKRKKEKKGLLAGISHSVGPVATLAPALSPVPEPPFSNKAQTGILRANGFSEGARPGQEIVVAMDWNPFFLFLSPAASYWLQDVHLAIFVRCAVTVQFVVMTGPGLA